MGFYILKLFWGLEVWGERLEVLYHVVVIVMFSSEHDSSFAYENNSHNPIQSNPVQSRQIQSDPVDSSFYLFIGGVAYR